MMDKYCRQLRSILVGISLFYCLCFFGVYSVGATGLPFSLTTIPSKNQVNRQLSYFDLHQQPGDQEKLVVCVTNRTKQKLLIKNEFYTASTSSTGTICYEESANSVEDSAPYDLAKQVEVREPLIQLQAYETKQVCLLLNYPPKDFTGILLGGWRFYPLSTEKKAVKVTEGVTLHNHFAAVKGVTIHGSRTYKKNKLKLKAVTFKPNFLHSYVTIQLENPIAKPLVDACLTVDINNNQTGKTVYHQSYPKISIAPNNKLNFPVELVDIKLPPADYQVQVRIEKETQRWRFGDTFQVIQAKEKRVANQMRPRKQTNLFLGASVAMVLLGSTVLLYFIKKLTGK